MKDTKIEFAHHTLNLWWGCTEVHTGCDHCYATTFAKRVGKDIWGAKTPRVEIKTWKKRLLEMQRLAELKNEIQVVFASSMMDIAEKSMPMVSWQGEPLPYSTGDVRKEFFDIAPNCKNLFFLFFTKRPSNINKIIPEEWKIHPPDNIMWGASVVNQETANKLIPQLLEVKGYRLLSVGADARCD